MCAATRRGVQCQGKPCSITSRDSCAMAGTSPMRARPNVMLVMGSLAPAGRSSLLTSLALRRLPFGFARACQNSRQRVVALVASILVDLLGSGAESQLAGEGLGEG